MCEVNPSIVNVVQLEPSGKGSVLHRVLYSQVHVNGVQKKKKSQAAKYGLAESKRRRIPSSIRDDTIPNRACSTQCRLAYLAKGKLPSARELFELPSNWSRVPKQA
jgi:hypothetical protein